MKASVLTLLVAVAILSTVAEASAAQNEIVIQRKITHSHHVIAFFQKHGWMRASHKSSCIQVPWRKTCKIARRTYKRHMVRLPKLRELLVPVGEAEIRAYLYAVLPDDEANCLARIIEPETGGTWSPTIWNGQGSGAYGLPQALPGYKMASAGSDWATNPKTQIRWMISYAESRYGGPCEAYWYRERNGTY